MTDDRLRTGGALDALRESGEALVPRLSGRVLSGYRIGDLLGSGGMGYVFHGERAEGDFERVAAVKVVPTSLGASEIGERFRTEVKILATLNHASIAQLYDAGETAEGWPYLVMEFVDGRPIDSFCETESLGVDERIRLVLEVSRAVRFAHARLVVHRDIKPSNVLVTRDRKVKLLDFGIAKLLEPGTPQHTVAHRPMTPQYASPEQLLGADITIGSDVYQLGLLLLACVAGETPFESMTFQEAVRAAAQGRDAAISRRMAATMPPDLLAIITCCLHSSPEDRYADVNALVADLERYLEGYPVAARKAGRLYRIGKLVRRNVPATAFALLASLIAVGGTAYYTVNINEARRVAEQRAETSSRVLTALSSLVTETFDGFIDHNADQQSGTAAVVESVLEDTASVLREALAEEPDARGELLRVQGSIEQALGDYPAARRAFDEAAATLGAAADRERYVDLALARANVAIRMADIETGRELMSAIAGQASSLELPSALRVEYRRVEGALAAVENRYEDAIASLDEAIAIADGEARPDGRRLANLYTSKMYVYDALGDNPSLLRAAGNALALLAETDSAYSSKRVAPLRLSARAHVLLGDLKAARNALDEAMSIARGNFGEMHPLVAEIHHTYGLLEYYSKDLQRAVGHVEQEVEILETLYGPDHLPLQLLLGNLGVLYTDIGEMEKAAQLFLRQREALDADTLEDRDDLLKNAVNEARRLRAIGDYARAIEFEQRGIQFRRALFGENSIAVADGEDDIALALYGLERYAEAREWFLRGAEKYRITYGDDSPEYREKMLYFWRYDLVDGNLAAARDKLHEIMMEEVEGEEVDAIWPVHMFTDLAHINLLLGDTARAEQALEWAQTGAETAPRHPWGYYTDVVEAEIRLAQGDYVRARAFAEKARSGLRDRFPLHTARIERAEAVLAAIP